MAYLLHAIPQRWRLRSGSCADGQGMRPPPLRNRVPAWQARRASDAKTADLVDDAIYALSRSGPALGRPLVDTVTGSKIKNLKELRPSSGTCEIRILFVFDPRLDLIATFGDHTLTVTTTEAA
jgi:hypothetical protein